MKKAGLLSIVPDRLRKRNDLKAWSMFLLDLCFYLATLVGTIVFENVALKLIFAFSNGIAIGLLFILGHDCVHGIFFKSRFWNNFIGQICFFPSLTPTSLWRLGHNYKHHKFTNLVPHDYAWAPKSFEQYNEMSGFRKLLERFYRSAFGHGIYYGVEVWWKTMFFPKESDIKDYKPEYFKGSLYVLIFLGFIVFSATYISANFHDLSVGQSIINVCVYSIFIPFIVWLYLVGFLTYMQHTHPEVKWFSDEAQWNFYSAQVKSTVFIVFPKLLDKFFHEIMHHNAHHIDVSIPLYNLAEGQRLFVSDLGQEIVQERITIRKYISNSLKCSLYDFKNQTWLGFDGQPICKFSKTGHVVDIKTYLGSNQ